MTGASSSPSTAGRRAAGAGAPRPRPRPGQVRIDVAAAGINFADVMARMGLYPDAPQDRRAWSATRSRARSRAGRGRAGAQPGPARASRARSSAATPRRWWCRAGDVARAARRAHVRAGRRDPGQLRTAWAGLIGYGNLQPGERVLIHSAGGGVGIAATQIAKRAGAEVYGTASPGKHARIAELGVDHALDYTQAGLGARPAEVRRDPRRRRRQELPAAATRCCAPAGAWSRSAPPRSSPAQRRNLVTALRTVAAHAALQPDQADVRIEGRDRPEHAHACGRTAGRCSRGSRRCASCSTTARSNRSSPATSASRTPAQAQTMITERRNVGKVVLVP